MNDYKELVDRLKFYADTADDMVYGICVNAPETMKIAAAAIEKLVKDRNVLQLQNHLERCEHEHTRKERDAAIADLHLIANNCFEDYVFSACCCCKKNDTCNGQPATGCEFEWRGVREASE